MNSRVWLVTGASSGLGKALMHFVLDKGDVCVGTVRKKEQKEALDALIPGRSYGVILDVTDHEACVDAVRWIQDEFGRIDVLVNNAGFGYFGAMEELTMAECREQFETNVFGAIRMSQLVLPVMRKQKSGYLLQVSSIAGFRSAAGLGIYNASKYALEGFSEAMYHELKPLNIHVVLIEPGPFRTEFAGRSGREAALELEAYKETAAVFRRTMRAKSGTQVGDPYKAAEKMYKMTTLNQPPLRLPLGRHALDGIRGKIKWVSDELKQWEQEILDTDFDH